MSNPQPLVTRATSIKQKIIRALMCAAGEHEPWERRNSFNGCTETVAMDIQSQMHDEVHCAVCKHCRTIYVRRRDE